MGPRAWNFSSALYYRGFTRFRLFRCDVGERIRARGRGKGRKIAAPCNIDFRDEYRRPWCLVAGTNALAAELVFQIRNFRATTWTLLKISSSLFPRYYNAYLFISLSLSHSVSFLRWKGKLEDEKKNIIHGNRLQILFSWYLKRMDMKVYRMSLDVYLWLN